MPLTRWARIPLGVLAVLLLVAVGGWLYVRARGNAVLAAAGDRWLSERIAVLSDSVYRARLHNLRYHAVTRSLRFDSATISTDVVRNQARDRPLPTLLVTVRGGRVAGIDVWELTRSRRVTVREVGYDGVNAIVTLPPHFRSDTSQADSGTTPRPADSAGAGRARGDRTLLVAIGQDRPGPIEGERTVFVRRVRFGEVTGRLAVPAENGVREFDLTGFTVDLDSVEFDRRRGADTPFRAADVRIATKAFSGRVDANDRLSFADLEASVADSTLRVGAFRLEPAEGDAAFFKAHAHRATRTVVAFDRLALSGLDWTGAILGERLAVRHMALDGLLLDLLLDKRKPANPVRKPKPSPQQRVARLRGELAIDTITVRKGVVRYAERVATAPVPGVLHFDGINATLVNLTNDSTRQTERTPARLTATARFMGRGALQAEIAVPLLAPDYRADLHATLGRMPATALNEVLVPLVGAEIAHGTLDRVRVDAVVRRGVYGGRLVPEFTDLGVQLARTAAVKREEKKGLKGFLKGAARSAKNVAANTFVRDDNPEKPGKPVRTGTIRYVRTPTDSFWSAFWKSLKPALAEAVVAIKL